MLKEYTEEEFQADWKAACAREEIEAEKKRAWFREHYKRNRGKILTRTRGNYVKRVYNLTLKEYEEKLEAQGGVCAICKTTEPGGSGKWHLDHHHETGKIRKFLCFNCNTMLGMAKEDIEVLRAAAKYLEENS